MGLKSFGKKMFGSGPGIRKAGLLTKQQKITLNMMNQQAQQYLPQVTRNLFDLAAAPGGGQFFQQAFANPYLTQRDRAWDEIQQQMGYRHGSSQQKMRGQFYQETSQNMLAQQAQMQMSALGTLYGGLGQGALGTKAFENVVTPGSEGWLSRAGQVLGVANSALQLGGKIYGMGAGGGATSGVASGPPSYTG